MPLKHFSISKLDFCYPLLTIYLQSRDFASIKVYFISAPYYNLAIGL